MRNFRIWSPILTILVSPPKHFEQLEDARKLRDPRQTALLENVVQRENAHQVDQEPALHVVDEDFLVRLDDASVAVVGREAGDHHVWSGYRRRK